MEIDSRRIRRLLQHSRSRERSLDRVLGALQWLDPFAGGLQKAVGAFYETLGRPGHAIKDVMHGTAVLRHPLHPALTDLPLGAWTLGVLADWLFVVTGRVPAVAGDLALAFGLAGAILSALTGLTDFHETAGLERRTALLHGLTMTVVVAVEIASLALRLSVPSMRMLAVVLSSIAWLLVVLGAYLGGHLTYGIGSAVNHNAFYEGPANFVRVGVRDDFPEGEMRRVEAGGLPVVIMRRHGLLYAMSEVCSHAGGPVHERWLDGEVVTCPRHCSKFRLGDGRVVGGPPTFDQPALITRGRDGIVDVKLAHPRD